MPKDKLFKPSSDYSPKTKARYTRGSTSFGDWGKGQGFDAGDAAHMQRAAEKALESSEYEARRYVNKMAEESQKLPKRYSGKSSPKR